MNAYPAEPAAAWPWAHDLVALAAGALVVLAGFVVHAALTVTDDVVTSVQGLHVTHPQGWLVTSSAEARLPTHLAMQSVAEPSVRITVRVDRRPAFEGPLGPLLDLARADLGPATTSSRPGVVELDGLSWRRIQFTYASSPSAGGAPILTTGTEYALVHADRLYVVTIHAPPGQGAATERELLSGLRIE